MVDKRIHTIVRGINDGIISAQEAHTLLQAEFGITLEQARSIRNPQKKHPEVHGTMPYIIVAGFVIAILSGMFYLPGSDLTGFAVFDLGQEELDSMLQNVTRLSASGTLWGEGSARILFDTGNSTLLIAEIVSDTGEPQTAKASYALGENVSIENAPEDASYYLDDGTNTTPVDIPFPASEGEVLIVTNETTYRVPISIGDLQRQTTFQEECVDTCLLESSDGNVRIETTGNTTLDMRLSGETDEPNNAPELAIPYAPVTVEDTLTVDLSGHFIDLDGNTLLYSTGLSDIISTEINGDTLTLTALQPGIEELIIYASDMTELVQTTMQVTVPNKTIDAENITEDPEVIPEIPVNITNTSEIINLTLDCSAADPNKRPVDCLTLESETYFEQPIFWESVARTRVAKFTTIGNLMITGDIIENSAGTPSRNDFKVIRKDSDFNEVAVVWIDSEGNLQITGNIHEEQHSLQPPSGSYSVINRRGVYLAYVDKRTGDLYIRGNLIPYRRSIE